jgi:hypothetical protein
MASFIKGTCMKGEYTTEIYCEICGKLIYSGGQWIDEKAGVCSGPCERELCGDCADWDVNGECEDCRKNPCSQCYATSHRNQDKICKNCGCHPDKTNRSMSGKHLEEKDG